MATDERSRVQKPLVRLADLLRPTSNSVFMSGAKLEDEANSDIYAGNKARVPISGISDNKRLLESILSHRGTQNKGDATLSVCQVPTRKRRAYFGSDSESEGECRPSRSPQAPLPRMPSHSTAATTTATTATTFKAAPSSSSRRPRSRFAVSVSSDSSSGDEAVLASPLAEECDDLRRPTHSSAAGLQEGTARSSGERRVGEGRRSVSAVPKQQQKQQLEEEQEDGDLDGQRPAASVKRNRPAVALALPGGGDVADSEVNRYLTAVLMDHQLPGVEWLWSKYRAGQGCVLSDDMGLGKTIQVIALLAAAYHKTGCSALDVPANRRRRRGQLEAAPPASLVVCPSVVLENWRRELGRWGYFLSEALETSAAALETVARAREGRVEVVLCSYEKMKMYAEELAGAAWELVVWDEGHMLNKESSGRYKAAMKLSRVRCRVILSGTPIQNKVAELWCLLNVVTRGNFADKAAFTEHFDQPIKRGKQASASAVAVALGRAREAELQGVLGRYLLQRSKEQVLGDVLKGKREVVVFCALAPLQSSLYQHVLGLPDFVNVRDNALKCPCGSGEKRGACCDQYRYPLDSSGTGIDVRAVIWRQNHPGDVPCPRCPTCCLLPCLNKLSRIASHPRLLQGRAHLAGRSEGDEQLVQFASEALPRDLLTALGGVYAPSDVLSQAGPQLSGKMATLQVLLERFAVQREKALVFSYSTKVLDLLEMFVRSRGWGYCRLDGEVSSGGGRRQAAIDSFDRDAGKLVFLLSTKAGGVGINLVSAAKVVQFDVCWNPSLDRQSQDRSYRLGQQREVTVYRLVAQGTIEEMTYMRQLYKNCLCRAALGGHSTAPGGSNAGEEEQEEPRFEGVEGDASARGELFGAFNLLGFEDGSILQRLRDKYAAIDRQQEQEQQEQEQAVLAGSNKGREDRALSGLSCMRDDEAAAAFLQARVLSAPSPPVMQQPQQQQQQQQQQQKVASERSMTNTAHNTVDKCVASSSAIAHAVDVVVDSATVAPRKQAHSEDRTVGVDGERAVAVARMSRKKSPSAVPRAAPPPKKSPVIVPRAAPPPNKSPVIVPRAAPPPKKSPVIVPRAAPPPKKSPAAVPRAAPPLNKKVVLSRPDYENARFLV